MKSFRLTLTLFLVGALPLGALIPEIWEDGFYRASGGMSLCRFPSLPNPKEWKIDLRSNAEGQRVLQYTWLAEKGFRGYFNLMFNLKVSSEEKLIKSIGDLASVQTNGSPWLKAVGAVRKLPLQGGKLSLFLTHLEGVSPSGAKESCDVGAVSDGQFIVLVIIRGNQKDYEWMGKNLFSPVIESMRVGKTVPILTDRKPGAVLEGVWLGPYEASGTSGTQRWVLFDKRGYFRDNAPDSETGVSFDAAFQKFGDKAELATFLVQGGVMKVRWLGGKTQDIPLSVTGRKLVLDGKSYERVDGLSEGLTLAGRWETSTYIETRTANLDILSYSSSSSYTFTSGGRFTVGSSGELTTATRGAYRILADRLDLAFDNGGKASLPFYRRVKSGVVGNEILYIGGRNFLKSK